MSELEQPSSKNAMNPTWSSEWLRGFLPFFVLNILSVGPSYGYAISADLAQSGIGDVRGGTLYPLLLRLEAAGFVSTTSRPGTGGPGRKYFDLTPAGTDELLSLIQISEPT